MRSTRSKRSMGTKRKRKSSRRFRQRAAVRFPHDRGDRVVVAVLSTPRIGLPNNKETIVIAKPCSFMLLPAMIMITGLHAVSAHAEAKDNGAASEQLPAAL